MTSGSFHSVPVDSIWVDRAKRQRRELNGIEELADSIRRTGLINPPVIRRDGELIAGERRWEAIKTLGWTHLPAQYVDELSEAELQLIEFEENIRRTDLSWQDQCLAIYKYHNLRVSMDENWSRENTGEALGFSKASMTGRFDVAEQIIEGNKRVIDADKYSAAKGIVQRDKERRKTSVIATIKSAGLEKLGTDLIEESPVKTPPLLCADFLEWAQTNTEQFNFIHCDFPYGVGMDKSDQGSGAAFGTYEDSPDVYFRLLSFFARITDKLAAESAHLMFWFSMDYYQKTKDALEAGGWKINPFPLIWYKSDNIGILPDAKRGPRRIYETCFFGSRGDRNIVGPVSNVFAYPGRTDKLIHMNQKPVPMLQHFMRMFVDEYSIMLDPTCGSGNACKAAEALKANSVLGIERDTKFYNLAMETYYAD